jgi:dTDP-4-dehydrorhamnose reductase
VKRILLLGKNGQLGWELQRALAPLAELIALDRKGGFTSNRRPLGSGTEHAVCGDLGQLKPLEATVRALNPDVIVNAAAYTAVDKAESEPEVARAINAVAPGVLARLGAEIGATLIHYSTDYVFDGSGSVPWREDDPTGPLSVYGSTKLEGESQVCGSGCRHLIIRTSWVYAARGANFAKTMLRLAGEREALRVIDDQVGAPTGADLLADATAHALRALDRDASLAGTYHVAASGETSWFGYARFIIERARAKGWTFSVAPESILPVPTSAYPLPARRPSNSRLDCGRFTRAFGLYLPAWEFGVERMLDELTPASL